MGKSTLMAAQTQTVVGVVLLIAGGGPFLASGLHVWLARRVSVLSTTLESEAETTAENGATVGAA
jgi:hypothetical protein